MNDDAGVIPLHLLLATTAKVLCSAVFLSGRGADEALRHSAGCALHEHQLPGVLPDLVTADIDRDARCVSVALHLDPDAARRIVGAYRDTYPVFTADWDGEVVRLSGLGRVERRAVFTGEQGSVILPRDGGGLRFTPEPVASRLPPAGTLPWPMGERLEGQARRSGLDRARVAAAIDLAFADPAAHTAAVVVLHHGELVGERYRPGIGPDTQLESWSMGKSLTATLLGVLAQQGLVAPDQPAPLREWQQPGDPRAAIRVRDLLQMSGGLRFSGQDDPRTAWRLGVPDHLYLYCEALDAFAFCLDRPLEHPPGTVGRYRNCDTLALGCIIRRSVTEQLGQSYLAWPQAALFDRLGIRRQVLETDLCGNFLLTGFDYATARNWARLGQLYLQDGIWQDQRVLPEGWARLVSTPAPAWPEGRYGGQFWLNTPGDYHLPRPTFYAAGAGEQRLFIVPTDNLVIVRLGHNAVTDAAKRSVNAMLRSLMAAAT